jgi:hypothetical protein
MAVHCFSPDLHFFRNRIHVVVRKEKCASYWYLPIHGDVNVTLLEFFFFSLLRP